ncbi:MAG: acyl-CoA thioesterase, partial [Clostridiales bacterium]|nr:acyl-CoA thioesterase [Clostridiales bacterium]
MRKFKAKVRVPYADTDRMGIVYHANYIKYFEVGRTEFLREIGYPYAQLEADGIWLPVASVSCEYKSPAWYDDLLEVNTWVGSLKGATIVMAYEIFREGTGELIAKGETKHPVTDDKLKPIKLRN